MPNWNQQVIQRDGDPRVYLNVMGHWYYYDPNSTPLGNGAMGTVYLGFSCHSNQRIAVKRVKDMYANNEMIRQRAKQEAALAFSHPNLVQMIGICEVAPNYGPIFILSGYVAGISLESHVNELNDRCNEAIGKGQKELILTSEELPVKESWSNCCEELIKAGLKDVEQIPEGIKIILLR